MRTSTLLLIGAALYYALKPKTASAATGPLPAPPPAKPAPKPVPGETPAQTGVKQETWARSQAPKGWDHQYYYETHWVFEYVHNPPASRFYLVFFDGQKGWSDDPNHL